MLATAALVLALVAADGSANAEPSEPAAVGDQIYDAMVLRPLGFLGTTVGFAFFVCSIPLAGPSLQLDTAWDQFVQQPADFTFYRALGDF